MGRPDHEVAQKLLFCVGGLIKICRNGCSTSTRRPLAIPRSCLPSCSGAALGQAWILRWSQKWGARLDETQNFTFHVDETRAFFLQAAWLAKVSISFRRDAWFIFVFSTPRRNPAGRQLKACPKVGRSSRRDANFCISRRRDESFFSLVAGCGQLWGEVVSGLSGRLSGGLAAAGSS